MCFQIFHVKSILRVGHVTMQNVAHDSFLKKQKLNTASKEKDRVVKIYFHFFRGIDFILPHHAFSKSDRCPILSPDRSLLDQPQNPDPVRCHLLDPPKKPGPVRYRFYQPTDLFSPGTGTGGEIGFWVSQDQEMTDFDEEHAYHNGSGDDGSPERLCDDTPEVVDRYVREEFF